MKDRCTPYDDFERGDGHPHADKLPREEWADEMPARRNKNGVVLGVTINDNVLPEEFEDL